ncbi:MAG: hypothetical protein CHACPFDD_02137 [Phycisphaerae bacterium]|nr:hypothetical protein [Phycisphaerae bacterium]
MVRRLYRPTVALLGPRHDGLRLSVAEFERAEFEDGYRYELIDGELIVSPTSSPVGKDIAVAVFRVLDAFNRAARQRPFAAIVWEPRVFVSTESKSGIVPQPDLAAYGRYPAQSPASYRGIDPALVVEVVSRGSVEKDYVRNRRLHAQVRSILEYWIIDPTEDQSRPAMTAHVRTSAARSFRRVDVSPGGVYESAVWNGLNVNLRRLVRHDD